jgi:hypothetical protein
MWIPVRAEVSSALRYDAPNALEVRFESPFEAVREAIAADPACLEAYRDLGDLQLRDLKDRAAAEDLQQLKVPGAPAAPEPRDPFDEVVM